MNQIEKTPLNQIQPHPKNARKGNAKLIAESLKENGQYKPIIVDAKTGNILAGNHTYQAAVELGWDTINTIQLPNLTAKQATKILLADNRTSDNSAYDYDQLTQLIDEIRDDLEGTGWTDTDLNYLENNVNPTELNTIDVDSLTSTEQISLHQKQTWELGENLLNVGDDDGLKIVSYWEKLTGKKANRTDV